MKKTSAILSGISTLAFAGTLAAGTAIAQTSSTTSTTATSTATTESIAPTLSKKISASYSGLYSGPAVTKLGNIKTPDETGALGGYQNLDSVLSASYKTDSGMSAGVGVPFILTPFSGVDVVLKDPYLKLSRGNLLTFKKLSISGDIRTYAGISAKSRNAGRVGGIRLNQSFTFEPNNRLSLGVATFQHVSLFIGGNAGRDLTLYLAPFLNYQITSKLAFMFWNDLVQLGHKRGARILDMDNDPIAVQTGVSYDLTSRVNVSPFLNIYPTSLKADSTTLNLQVSAKLL